jgi:hypothetical protein
VRLLPGRPQLVPAPAATLQDRAPSWPIVRAERCLLACIPAGVGLFSSFEGTDHSDRLQKTFNEVQTVCLCNIDLLRGRRPKIA